MSVQNNRDIETLLKKVAVLEQEIKAIKAQLPSKEAVKKNEPKKNIL